MAAHPLLGADYHTADFTSPDIDPEAVDSYGPSEKEPPNTLQTSRGTTRLRRGRPVMLIILLLCCLAFVASAFARSASNDRFFTYLNCVPERYAPLADNISAAFRPEPNADRVYLIQESAVDIWEQKYNPTLRVGCHAANVRDYMRQTYSVVESSLHWTNVSRSAVVLHWQGTDRKLQPVAILNSCELYGPEEDSQCEEEVVDEYVEELAEVQSAVGMLTAVEALVQNGYQPSRTLVLSLMLGDAADAPKVTEYLRSTYDGFKLPPPERRSPILEIFDRLYWGVLDFFDMLYWGVTALFPILAAPHCSQIELDDDKPEPLFFYYILGSGVSFKEFPAKGVNMWTRLIIAAGQ